MTHTDALASSVGARTDEASLEPLSMNAKTTAVLVVDALNDFFSDSPRQKRAASARKQLLENMERINTAARQAGMSVVWICDRHRPDDPEFDRRGEHCVEGTWGAEIVSELTTDPSDIVVPKRRYSGFFGTSLDLHLRELNTKTVIVTGVATNVCVRSTVHDAYFLGYDVVVPQECVAASAPREQASSLHDIDVRFGRVCSLDECLEAIAASQLEAS